MAKDTKFSEEEMKKIKEVQNSYIGVQHAFGQLEVNRLRLEQQLDSTLKASDDLRNKFNDIQKDEQSLIEELNTKYGDGTLDLDSGTFTPNKSE
jgi:predicted nuclease with TOPRIM domain